MSGVPLYDAFAGTMTTLLAGPRASPSRCRSSRPVAWSRGAACSTSPAAPAPTPSPWQRAMVTMADLSAGMVAAARDNAARHGARLREVKRALAGWRRVGRRLTPSCLGNSLPHALINSARRRLSDMARVLALESSSCRAQL